MTRNPSLVPCGPAALTLSFLICVCEKEGNQAHASP